MKCIIPGPNTKIFSKAIQSLAKIGSELFIEASRSGLSIRTVNSTKSAFAFYKFLPVFFTDYSLDSCSELNKCKISIKICLGAFKSIKNVEHCKITIDGTESKLVIQFKCRLETLKTHLISIIDVETLQASYSKDKVPNKISASHKLLTEISNNFQMNEEEITLEANSDKLVIKNYVEGAQIDRRFMRSQLSLRTDEFEKYLIDNETSITFCLREFRALLSFAESVSLPMTIHFETAGRPVVFILENLQTFEANLVMSTLSPEDISTYEGNSTMNSTLTTNNNEVNLNQNSTRKRNKQSNKTELLANKKPRIEENDNSNSQTQLFNFKNRTGPKSIENVRENNVNTHSDAIQVPLLSQPHEYNRTDEQQDNRCNVEADTNEYNRTDEQQNNRSNVEADTNEYNQIDKQQDNHCNAEADTVKPSRNDQIENQQQNTENIDKDSNRIFVTFKGTEEIQADDNYVPASPPKQNQGKRARVIFRRCFEATFNPKEISKSNQVLAPSSDTED